MTQKLVGREGMALIEPPVTGRVDRVLPISRTTRKQATAQKVLTLNLAVDFRTPHLTINPYTPNELYRVLRQFGYRWVGQTWRREYPDWVKVGN